MEAFFYQFPALFFSKENDIVFSEWVVKKKFRNTLILFLGFLLTFIPYKKFLKT